MNREIKSLRRSIKINNLFLILLLGVVLNLSVIVFNESRMPVFFHETETIPQVDQDSYTVFRDSSEVNYAFLSDILKIWKLRFSIGDFLIFSSGCSIIFIYAQGVIKSWRFKHGTVISSRK